VLHKRHAARATVPGALLAFLLLAGPDPARGQDPAAGKTFSTEEIEQLVAPIALYPDELLAQILMAATYPLEIVEARRWRTAHPELADAALATALEAKEWDASVKSLINLPDVLRMMDERLDWTQKLGNAFLAQEEEVMAAVQRLRKKAQEAGNLQTTDEQRVVVEREWIVIECCDPEVIYIPVYDPLVVYGPWWYPRYPPYRPWPHSYGSVLFSFTRGFFFGITWGYAWGGCDWPRRVVAIDVDRNSHRCPQIDRSRHKRHYEIRTGGRTRDGKGRWEHDPAHRRGVRYADPGSQRRFAPPVSRTAPAREAYRGRETPAARPPTARQPAPRSPTERPPAGGGRATQPRPPAGSRAPGAPTRPPAATERRTPSFPRTGSSPGAFGDYSRRSQVQQQSSRGLASRSSVSRSSDRRSSDRRPSDDRRTPSRGSGRSGGDRDRDRR